SAQLLFGPVAGDFIAFGDVSPDGKRLLISVFNGVLVANLGGGGPPAVLSVGHWANWSPDGSRIAFQKNVSGASQLFVMDADGKHVVQVTHEDENAYDPKWSPDGKYLIYISGTWPKTTNIYVIRPDGSGRMAVTAGNDNLDAPAWGPGDTIYFAGH